MIWLAALLLAAPPDARIALRLRAPHIEKVAPGFGAVETDGDLRAELLPSDELLLEPRARGVFHVFLYARRFVRVLEVAVDVPLPPAPAGGCAVVRDAATYEDCLAKAAPDGKITFELEGLQAEAKAAQAALGRGGLAHVSVALSPYGVKLKGARDEAEKRRALRTIWPWLLTPLRLDD